MITEIKFAPERQRLYKLKVWIAMRLWRLAYNIHPWPPKFHEQISDDYVDGMKRAREDIKKLESYILNEYL